MYGPVDFGMVAVTSSILHINVSSIDLFRSKLIGAVALEPLLNSIQLSK